MWRLVRLVLQPRVWGRDFGPGQIRRH